MEKDLIGKPNILIVDDNDSLCKTMSFILSRKGCDVTVANDGFEAVQRVKEGQFDIIFMDIKMPQMDGVETLKEIKKIRSEVVVMMTAYSVDGLVEEAMEEGAYRVLYKPLDMPEVLGLLDEIQEKKQKDSMIGKP